MNFTRVAGFGGLGFLATVVTENILRQPQPMASAGAAEIAAYYQARPGMIALSESLYVVAIPCLLLFCVGTARRLRDASKDAEPWANLALLGAAMMTATFGAMMALDVVLLSTADTLVANAALTTMVWRLKIGMFLVNLVTLSCAVTAFGNACRIASVGPRWLATLATGAGVLGLAGAFPMRANVEGSPLMLLGLGCFLVWMVFLAVTSIDHLKAERDARSNDGHPQTRPLIAP